MALKMRTRKRLILVLTCAVALTQAGSNAPAQKATSGSLSGRVTDQRGAWIPDATITAISGGRRWVAISGDEGRYSLILPPGKYKIVVDTGGFYSFRKRGIRIVGGADRMLDVMLKGILNDSRHP
jgi:hypothetical protein